MSARRQLAPGPLVLATHNAGKVREITALVAPFGMEPVSAAELNLPEPDETALTFIGNAQLKSLAAATATGMVSLSDDSGLCVDALQGAPGIYSARWADGARDFARAMARVAAELDACHAAAPYAAHFICALSLAWPDGHTEDFEGRVTGTLVFPPRGTRGFGYDPIFVADGCTQSFGEMDPDAKHAISHRAHAFAQLVAQCLTR